MLKFFANFVIYALMFGAGAWTSSKNFDFNSLFSQQNDAIITKLISDGNDIVISPTRNVFEIKDGNIIYRVKLTKNFKEALAKIALVQKINEVEIIASPNN